MKWIHLLWVWSTKDSGGIQFKNVGFYWEFCGAQFLWCTQKRGHQSPSGIQNEFWLGSVASTSSARLLARAGCLCSPPSCAQTHSVLIASSVSASLPHLLMCNYNFHNHWNHYNSQGLLLWRSLQAYIAKNFNCACLNNVDLEAPYLDLNSPLIAYILSIIHEASVKEGFATGYKHFLFLDFHHIAR